jgi:hypothetical protein
MASKTVQRQIQKLIPPRVPTLITQKPAPQPISPPRVTTQPIVSNNTAVMAKTALYKQPAKPQSANRLASTLNQTGDEPELPRGLTPARSNKAINDALNASGSRQHNQYRELGTPTQPGSRSFVRQNTNDLDGNTYDAITTVGTSDTGLNLRVTSQGRKFQILGSEREGITIRVEPSEFERNPPNVALAPGWKVAIDNSGDEVRVVLIDQNGKKQTLNDAIPSPNQREDGFVDPVRENLERQGREMRQSARD